MMVSLLLRTNLSAMLAAVALSAGLAAAPAAAAPLNFTFSFTNAVQDGGTVKGIVRGLQEGTGAATSVEVTSNSSGFGVGEYVGSPFFNTWTVTGGVVTAFEFLAFGSFNIAPDVTDATLTFESNEQFGAIFRAGLSPDPSGGLTAAPGVSTTDFGLTFAPAPVPLPAAGLMLLAGLCGLAVVRRRAA